MIDKKFLIRGFHYSTETYRRSRITHLLCDLGKACNYRCVYCGNATHRDNGKNLTTRQRKKLVFDLREFGLKAAIFAGEGEPTADPDFRALIKHNYGFGITTIVYSNLSLVNPRLLEFMYNHDVSLIIKIDALEEEKYNRLTGSTEFSVFKENLESLRQIYTNQMNEKRIEISTVLTEINKAEPERIRKMCDENGFVYCCKTAGKKGAAEKNWKKIYPNGTRELERIAHGYTHKYQTTGDIQGNCAIAAHGIAVLKAGECVLCPSLTDWAYGNIKADSVEEILERKMRIYNSANKPPCIAKYVQNQGRPIQELLSTIRAQPISAAVS